MDFQLEISINSGAQPYYLNMAYIENTYGGPERLKQQMRQTVRKDCHEYASLNHRARKSCQEYVLKVC